jgi:hypothetical protein
MSTYCALADIENAFGKENVSGVSGTGGWVDLDNDGNSANRTARANAAIAYASDAIDDVVRNTNYTIPLATAASATPTTVTNLAAILAGLWLYEARGTQDMNPRTGEPVHRLAFRREYAERTLDQLRKGEIKLDAL